MRGGRALAVIAAAVVLDFVHAEGVKRGRAMQRGIDGDVKACTRAPWHAGPCNGWPTKTCHVWAAR